MNNPFINEYGTKYWKNDKGKLHRIDGPAIEDINGSKFWYINGKRHRLNEPACEYADGTKYWYLNGQRHRVDGPAIEWADGIKEWYLNGQRYRLDGPAVEYPEDGTIYWSIQHYNISSINNFLSWLQNE